MIVLGDAFQGRRTEAIKAMSVVTRMDVPKDALSQHRYFRALVTLGRHVKTLKISRLNETVSGYT